MGKGRINKAARTPLGSSLPKVPLQLIWWVLYREPFIRLDQFSHVVVGSLMLENKVDKETRPSVRVGSIIVSQDIQRPVF